MAQQPIPFWAYLIIGTAVTATSLIVNKQTGSANLILFVYIGMIFFGVGIIKLLFNLIFNKGSLNIAPKVVKTKVGKVVNKTNKNVSVITCPRCKVKLHPKFKFCPNCGLKLK